MPSPIILRRPSATERAFLADALRQETVGGALLLAATAVALIWANSPFKAGYQAIQDLHLGPAALGLDLTVAHWTSDGLLAIFFFVAGVELKRELVVGELRNPADAAVPIAAALGGMIVPALIYLTLTRNTPGATDGWAIPIATDIAFALAVLAIIGSALPAALRAFLLTLAVVDDLGAITVIATVYTETIKLWPLAAAAVLLALWWLLHRGAFHGWYVYLPLAVVIWALVYTSGVHATVAGVAMGVLIRVRTRPGEHTSPAERLEHLVRPWSAGVAVPLFALFAAGVAINKDALGHLFDDAIVPGIVVGLVVGKAIGVFGGAYLTARFSRARLSPDLEWSDVLGVAAISGIGFTVSLLIGELAFEGTTQVDRVKIAVLLGSLLAALLGSILLRRRHRWYQRINAEADAATAATATATDADATAPEPPTE